MQRHTKSGILALLFTLALIAVMMALTTTALAAGTTYYVDPANGSDSNAGTSESSAWKTFTNVNSTTFTSGDSILLKRGETFTVTSPLHPLGSGALGSPITIGAYGTGSKPVISAGSSTAAIALIDQSYWTIQNIETTGGNPYGIVAGVSGSNISLNGIHILNCSAHDVQGEGTAATDKYKGAIIVNATFVYNSATATSGCTANDILIDGCEGYVSDTSSSLTRRWAGILVGAGSWNETGRGTNVIVRNSSVWNVYGDGILLVYTGAGSMIENCVSANVGRDPVQDVGTPSAIWLYTCTSSVMQYNEAYGTKSPGLDGGGFDLDTGCQNCVVQYNYAHNNQSYGFLVYSGYEGSTQVNYTNSGSIIRYNISANNAQGGTSNSYTGCGDILISSYTYSSKGYVNNVQIYNNTIYWNPISAAPAMVDNYGSSISASYTSGSTPGFFKNNIVYSTSAYGKFLNIQSSKLVCNYNLYYNSTDTAAANKYFTYGGTAYTFANYKAKSTTYCDAAGRYADPQLASSTYMPSSSSPVIDAGTNVASVGYDYYGTSLPQGNGYDIGAVEYKPKTPVTGVALDSSALTLKEGKTAQLTATVSPSAATDLTVSWSSSDSTVATVDQAGLVTAVKAGDAVITVTTNDGGYTATCAITVQKAKIPVTAVALDSSALTLKEGKTAQLTATVSPSAATDLTVSWSSSDSAVATVDQTGLVTAVKAGDAVITVTTNDGGSTATCAVTVEEVVHNQVSLTAGASPVKLGDTLTIRVTVNNFSGVMAMSGHISIPGSQNAYISGCKKLLDDGSLVTNPVTPGDGCTSLNFILFNTASFTDADTADILEITVKYTGSTGTDLQVSLDNVKMTYANSKTNQSQAVQSIIVNPSAKITITVPVAGVSLDNKTLALKVGATAQLAATVSPGTATDPSISWSSSDGSVATVNQSGLVTAEKPGSAVITVTTTDGNYTDSCSVTVLVPVTGVSLADKRVILGVGKTASLTAQISPANAADKTVAWSSSDGTIAAVDQNGIVTALKAGSAVVTATTNDGGYTDACTVLVSGKKGDMDLDDDVDIDDLTILITYYGDVKTDDGWYTKAAWRGDLDGDGSITVADLMADASLAVGLGN